MNKQKHSLRNFAALESGGVTQRNSSLPQTWVLIQKAHILKMTLPQKNGSRIKTPSSKLMILGKEYNKLWLKKSYSYRRAFSFFLFNFFDKTHQLCPLLRAEQMVEKMSRGEGWWGRMGRRVGGGASYCQITQMPIREVGNVVGLIIIDRWFVYIYGFWNINYYYGVIWVITLIRELWIRGSFCRIGDAVRSLPKRW